MTYPETIVRIAEIAADAYKYKTLLGMVMFATGMVTLMVCAFVFAHVIKVGIRAG